MEEPKKPTPKRVDIAQIDLAQFSFAQSREMLKEIKGSFSDALIEERRGA